MGVGGGVCLVCGDFLLQILRGVRGIEADILTFKDTNNWGATGWKR